MMKKEKLDDKVEPMVFLRYHSTSTYKYTYNDVNKLLVMNKDIIVNESES